MCWAAMCGKSYPIEACGSQRRQEASFSNAPQVRCESRRSDFTERASNLFRSDPKSGHSVVHVRSAALCHLRTSHHAILRLAYEQSGRLGHESDTGPQDSAKALRSAQDGACTRRIAGVSLRSAILGQPWRRSKSRLSLSALDLADGVVSACHSACLSDLFFSCRGPVGLSRSCIVRGTDRARCIGLFWCFVAAGHRNLVAIRGTAAVFPNHHHCRAGGPNIYGNDTAGSHPAVRQQWPLRRRLVRGQCRWNFRDRADRGRADCRRSGPYQAGRVFQPGRIFCRTARNRSLGPADR